MDIYSRKCFEFIRDNIIVNKSINTDFFIKIYDNIKKMNTVWLLKKNNTKILPKLLDKNDEFLVMQKLKLVKREKLKNTLQSHLDVDKVDKLLTYMDYNNREMFVIWMIKYHRYIPSLRELTKSLHTSDIDRINVHCLLYNNPFVSINIQHHYEIHNTKYSSYYFDKGEIHMYEYNDMPKVDYNEIVKICVMMTNITNISKYIKIVFLGSPAKKKLWPLEEDKVMLPIHINSGSTLRGSFINIWRYEEWQKVLIHELIHYLEIDLNHTSNGFDKTVTYVEQKYNIQGKVLPPEAYTDTLAILLHTIYISTTYDDFMKNFKYEQNFSLFQAAKVLHYIGAKTIDDLKNTVTLSQQTSVFSYYILKAALLLDIDLFTKLFEENTIKYNNNVDQFIDIMEEVLDNNEFKTSIEKFIVIAEKNNNIKLYNSMRMSCLQF